MEEQDMAVYHQGALSTFALSEAEDNMEHNLHHTCAYQEDLMWQMATAEDQPALGEITWEEEQELNKIIEKKNRPTELKFLSSDAAAGYVESWGAGAGT